MTDHNREELIRQAALASVKKGARSDAEAVRNYREAARHAEIHLTVFEQAHAVQDAEEPEWDTERAVEILDAGGWERTTWESIGDARRMFPAAKFREVTRQVKAGPWTVVEQGDAS